VSADLHAKILSFLTIELGRMGGRRCTRVDLEFKPGAEYRDESLGQWDPEEEGFDDFARVERLVSTMIEVAENHVANLQPEFQDSRFVVYTRQYLGGRGMLTFKLAKAPEVHSALEELVARVIETTHAEAGKAEAAGEIGQFDAWQFALDAARTLRERVAVAQAAGSKDPAKPSLAMMEDKS
jgi:hypothetical protein